MPCFHRLLPPVPRGFSQGAYLPARRYDRIRIYTSTKFAGSHPFLSIFGVVCIAKSKRALAASKPPLTIPPFRSWPPMRHARALPLTLTSRSVSYLRSPSILMHHSHALSILTLLPIIFSRPIPTVTSPDPSRSYTDFKLFAKLAYRLTESQRQIRHLTDSSDSNGTATPL